MPKISIEKQLEKVAHSILDYLGVSGVSIEVYLVKDEVIHDLNRTYRSKDKVTNVLSFEAPDVPRPDIKERHLGEIYLASNYIKAHNEDIFYLLLHGILHLLGFDHIRKTDATKMENKEKEIMKALDLA